VHHNISSIYPLLLRQLCSIFCRIIKLFLCSYIVFCNGVDNFYVDDVHLRGDVYGLGYGIWAARLTAGTHTFYVPFGGMEGTSFKCNFTAKPNPGSNIMIKENYYETQLSPNVGTYLKIFKHQSLKPTL